MSIAVSLLLLIDKQGTTSLYQAGLTMEYIPMSKRRKKINPVHNNVKVKKLDKNGKPTISKKTQSLLDSVKSDRQKELDLLSQIEDIRAKAKDRAVKLQKDDGVKDMIDSKKKELTNHQEKAGKLITEYQTEIDKIASLESEISYYSGLVNPNVKKVKVKKSKENNGKFDITVRENPEGPNGLDIAVKYNVTNELFEFYINSQDNKIGSDDWKALRKSITKKLATYPELTADNGHGKNYYIRDMLNKLRLKIIEKRVIES